MNWQKLFQNYKKEKTSSAVSPHCLLNNNALWNVVILQLVNNKNQISKNEAMVPKNKKQKFKRKMKNTKKISVLVIFAAFVAIGIQGCSKYPDGQMINFQSRTERVANNWKVDNYKVNDVDYTSLVTDYTELYTKEGNYSYQWSLFSGTGTWEFQNRDTEILITGINNQSNTTLVILKLEEKEFWYYYMDGDDKKEFHLVQQ
jgi:hypothetical protein